METIEKLMSIQEAADLLEIKSETMRKWAAEGRVAVVRLARRALRIPASEIVRLQRESYRPAIRPDKTGGRSDG